MNWELGELSFEDYLQRRFKLTITHGISPVEAERVLCAMRSGQLTGSDPAPDPSPAAHTTG
jgi:hypothetical protein